MRAAFHIHPSKLFLPFLRGEESGNKPHGKGIHSDSALPRVHLLCA